MPEPLVSLISGASRGLGRAVALDFLQRGDQVHVVHRDPARRAELENAFGEGCVHRADLSRAADCERLLEVVHSTAGRLDVLVHAVGDYATGTLETTGPQTLARLVESNLLSAARLFDAARPQLRRADGCAVFFGCAGLLGMRARRDTAAYAAAKTALLAWARSLAAEEAPHGVRVNMVSPGVVPHEHASPDTNDSKLQARIPAGRPGRPDEIAAAVRFLTSSSAAHITGQNLEVAGGWML